ncbi:carboxypeptidase regulatory-like domain-containing protein [Silvibacterium dinghuense]|nr:carboxypeptidase regulatory-like domain-containing protein [Silvibacterium dinghuense]
MWSSKAFFGFLMLLFLFGQLSSKVSAQTGGEAGIQGTITDKTGAVVPNASVTAVNQATHVTTTHSATGDGLYTISPVIPGIYTVVVTAPGFQQFRQENLSVDALKLTGLNVTLQVGNETTEVRVTAAPPPLETTNATLGGVLENHTYENLPLQMSGQQRDPTAFATLLPGTVSGTRAPVIGGTGNYLAAVYVDGIPLTTINQQGDNRVVSNAIPVEAIDQFQVVTSTPAAEYSGAGLINFTLHSGASQYHGVVASFFRNTAFDTWGFTPPGLTVTNSAGETVPAAKPAEHQNEFVASGGGPIPFMRKRGFFYVTYDKYHGRSGVNPNALTVPTTLMREGNFSELSDKIYDPTSTTACTAANNGTLCRNQFSGNVIPTDYLSPVALKMEQYLPATVNDQLVNNTIAGVPSGYDNWEIASRFDFDLSPKQRLSYVWTYGVRKNVPFTVGNSGYVLPMPYTQGGYATIIPLMTDVEDNWLISNSMSNQLKVAFNRFSQPVESLTDGVSPYRATADLGITNLPTGQAADEFPGITFGTNTPNPTAEAQWTSAGASGATQTTVPNTYTLLDNFLLVKGKHSLTIGAQLQWLQDNVASQLGPSGIYTAAVNANSTANFVGSTLSTGTSGFSYASFLLGAMPSSGIAIQAVSETGGRYHDFSPYVQDDWKVTPKLTLNLGLRWDYLTPFHEVEDRWSFLNPDLTNTATGNKGMLQFAGNRGAGVSCQCTTPVQTYMKNFGPRIGFAYQVTPRTVIRGGYGLVYSLGGGVGGRSGAGNGTGATGFNVTATTPAEVTSGASAGPSYYLNNSTYFQGAGLANMAYGGPSYTLPTTPAINAAAQTTNTGNYLNSAGSWVTASSIAYADPYLSGRAPEFNLFNFGIQQALNDNIVLTMNYAGTSSHFLAPSAATARGQWSNQINPAYILTLGGVADSTGKTPLLGALATPANVAILQQAIPSFQLPYASISGTSSRASIAQLLVAFPQYSGVTDTWGSNVANLSYNSMQVSLSQRPWHGLSYTVNYTWSKNMGDDGTFRSSFNLPAGVVDGGKSYKMDRIDRSLTVVDTPQAAAAFGVWQMPFGKAGLTGSNAITRSLFKGWQISSIYTYASGVPLAITYGGCTAPLSGTCEPDYAPNFGGKVRINGAYGSHATNKNFTKQYINPAAFVAPSTYAPTTSGATFASPINRIGNAARTAPYGLRNPNHWNDDVSLRRTFPIHEQINFVFEVDSLNVANHPTFSGVNTAWGPSGTSAYSSFGEVTGASGNRDFQFAGHVNF